MATLDEVRSTNFIVDPPRPECRDHHKGRCADHVQAFSDKLFLGLARQSTLPLPMQDAAQSYEILNENRMMHSHTRDRRAQADALNAIRDC